MWAYLLGEHLLLAASATGAALGRRDAQFKAAAAALDANGVDIAKAIGSVHGQGAQDAFLPLWRRHIGFVSTPRSASRMGALRLTRPRAPGQVRQ